ncbi:hypothetical protein AVEN_263150-1 [Araneus ventricosus]|uniref:Uncharacterized protein n=1 Tax=Araneus ventricosus TaxID=182803 RepID=A0A4Y2F8Z5_ARAVE|nr:hypothetical protein AVEN_263150-1 [Araneus ventricosus]
MEDMKLRNVDMYQILDQILLGTRSEFGSITCTVPATAYMALMSLREDNALRTYRPYKNVIVETSMYTLLIISSLATLASLKKLHECYLAKGIIIFGRHLNYHPLSKIPLHTSGGRLILGGFSLHQARHGIHGENSVESKISPWNRHLESTSIQSRIRDSAAVAKRPPPGVVRKFGEGMPAQVSSSSSDCG